MELVLSPSVIETARRVKKRKNANGSERKATKVFRNDVSNAAKDHLSTITNKTIAKDVDEHRMLTRGVTTGIVRNVVFNTSELFENILLQLPGEDIITARQVNHHWNTVILTSPRLLRKLFLRPAFSMYPLWVFDPKDGALRTSHSGDQLRFENDRASQWKFLAPAELNPLLFVEEALRHKPSLAQRARTCETKKFKATLDVTIEHSIYHHMFVCLPPVCQVEFEFRYNNAPTRRGSTLYHFGDANIRVRVVNENGVTFGDIVDKFLAEVGRKRICILPSKVWMPGVIFPTDDEVEAVQQVST